MPIEENTLDNILFLEMDVEAAMDAELADYSYLDNIMGDDLNNPIYNTADTDIDINELELEGDEF